MRPNDSPDASTVYECFVCGDREASPATCSNCGGALRNLGVPRDL